MEAIFSFLTGEYALHVLILVCISSILAQGFNVCFGLGHLFNLAHVASYSIGAYTVAILSVDYGYSFWPCLASAVLMCVLFSVLLGGISLRLKGDYFAIGSLAFSFVVLALLINWRELTRGVLGIAGIPRPEVFGKEFYESSDFFFLALGISVICHAFLFLCFRNAYSRKLRAQAEYEEAALACGIPTARCRLESFVLASACAGLSGALYAYYVNYIDPSSFTLTEMIFVLSIVIIGVPGSFWGIIAATVFLVMLPEALRFTGDVQPWFEGAFALSEGEALNIPILNLVFEFLAFASSPEVLGPMRQLLYAFVMYLMVLKNRDSLFPTPRKV